MSYWWWLFALSPSSTRVDSLSTNYFTIAYHWLWSSHAKVTVNWLQKAADGPLFAMKGSTSPYCYSLLISLKTVNEQRGRKVGGLFWLPNDRDRVWLVCSLAVSRPYLSPWLLCLSWFALLTSILSFPEPQRNWVFAFYICFVQMPVLLFSMWGRALSGVACTFINRQKKESIL